ncbi:MAG: NACHT domain-containing protein [Rhodospirillaceae bacterium]
MFRGKLFDCLGDNEKRDLGNVIACAEKILHHPVDLSYTDHTISHKHIVHAHLDSFLGPWLEEQRVKHNEDLVRTEVMVLLSATYLHDIGMQMAHPRILAALPSLTDAERRAADALPKDGITEKHREFARRFHHTITHDWILGSSRNGLDLPPLDGLDNRRSMVAKVARAHNIWLTNPESYQEFKDAVAPAEEPVGTVRLDLLAAFLRLADILDQDKRRVDMNAAKRLAMPVTSMVHWWRHHYVNACRLEKNNDHAFPLTVAFRLPKEHEGEQDWLWDALYSATVNEIKAELQRLSPWLGRSGIHVVIPDRKDCRCDVDGDPEIKPMPDEVREAFSKTWRQAEGAAGRARLHSAAEEGRLTGDKVTEVYSSLAAAFEIKDYIDTVDTVFRDEFRDRPYSPLELRVENQPGLKSALAELRELLRAPQTTPQPIVLVGEPGGGKTMLLRRYVWEWSGRGKDEIPLPVYIQSTRYGSAEWAARMEARMGTRDAPCSGKDHKAIQAEALEQFELLLVRTLRELMGLPAQHEAAVRRALESILAARPVAVLFDGINELPPMLYELASLAIKAFIERYRGQRVVVTSRTGDFRPADFPDRVYCELQPMTEEAVRAYWTDAAVSASAIRRFFETATQGMPDLVRTPMAAFMTGELLKLPESEAISSQGRLFQRYVRETLRKWRDRTPHSRLSVDQTQTLLSEIAFRAFETLQVSFPEELAIEVATRWLEQLDAEDTARLSAGQENSESLATSLFQELLASGFLLKGSDPTAPFLRFRHHTLQDYFAAVAITRRWERLPEIVAQPVFHEAVGMVAGVVEDPARFVERLGDATSDNWGFIQLLPLLFRVIGASRVAIPQIVLLRIFAATLPLYSAAVALLSPYAVEVLCHLFAQTDWQVLARFLAFIAGSPERPEWEKELARVDAVKAMNRDGHPTPETLEPFFAARIPPELRHDHEAAKEVLATILREENGVAALERVPLLLGGIAASVSLAAAAKIEVVRMI